MTAFTRTVPTESVGTSGDPSPAIVHVGYAHTDLTYELNRLAATLDNGRSTLSAQGAANVWASITGPWEEIPDPEEAATATGTGGLLSLVGALNVKNSTTDLGLRAVCNALGGTTDMDPAYALSQIETPT